MSYLNTILLILCTFISAAHAQESVYALCVAPVAEALGAPTPAAYKSSYFALPCMFYKDATWLYGRKHQLIFQEVVEVLDEKDEQYLIKLPGVFYETKLSRTPDTTAWVHKSQMHLLPARTMAKLPPLLACERAEFMQALEDTGALTAPYYEPTLRITLSAGARFLIHGVDDSTYHVGCYNPHNRQIITVNIPKEICVPFEKRTAQEQRELFVQLARAWADQSQGPLAYVLGGNSIITRHPKQQPGTVTFFGQRGFNWPHNERPASGLDCSGLIVRAAHIVGIPFFYKNSVTMARYLRETTTPELGDILWLPGHVMVLSDLEKGLLVEARGYPSGYGIVQEIPLSEQFYGIDSVEDLVASLKAQKPLRRLNKRGEVVEVCPDYKILSLIS